MKIDDDYFASDNVRKGKWTTEEENYSNKLITLFNQGLLSIPPGTTLRSHLSEKLSCDPMRITKKFAGASCIGKQVFHPCESTDANATFRRESMKELDQLEKIFLTRIQTKAAAQDRAHRYEQQLISNRRHTEEMPAPVHSPNGRGIKNKHNPALDAPPPPPAYLQSPDSDGHTSNSTSFSSEHYMDSNRSSLSGQGDSSSFSSGVFQKNKRIMSAPDLTQMSLLAINSQHTTVNNSGASTQASVSLSSSHNEDYFGIAYQASLAAPGAMQMSAATLFQSGSSNSSGLRKSPTKLPKGKVISSTTTRSSGGLRSSTHGTRQSSSHNNSSTAGSSSVKKSHSMMDLGNYEKMAADDRAAGEMFFQFVQTLGDKYTDRDCPDSLSSNRPLSVSSLSDLTLTHQAMFGSSQHTTPSPNAASMILARQFMTIDDVISATVAEDFSSFSMSESASLSFAASNESKFSVPSPYHPLPTLSDMSSHNSSGSTLSGSNSSSLSNLLHCDSPMLLSAKMEDMTRGGGGGGYGCSSSLTSSSGMTLNSQEVTQQLNASSNDSQSSKCSVSRGVADLYVDQSASAAESERQRLNSEESFFRSSEDNFF